VILRRRKRGRGDGLGRVAEGRRGDEVTVGRDGRSSARDDHNRSSRRLTTGAEVFCGASSKDQAGEVFRTAKAMAEASPDFLVAYGVWVNTASLVIQARGAAPPDIVQAVIDWVVYRYKGR